VGEAEGGRGDAQATHGAGEPRKQTATGARGLLVRTGAEVRAVGHVPGREIASEYMGGIEHCARHSGRGYGVGWRCQGGEGGCHLGL
jgi:hypothetical protein